MSVDLRLVPAAAAAWAGAAVTVVCPGRAVSLAVIAANAAGFATSWLTEWFAYDRRVLDALGLAPTEKLAGFVHIGRAREVPSDPPRPARDALGTNR